MGYQKSPYWKPLKQRGFATGIITTSELTDASPSAYYAHVESRGAEHEIALQLVGAEIDVLIGATGIFSQDESDLVQQFINQGYQLIKNRQELLEVNEGRLIGLFDQWGSEVTDLSQLTDEQLPDLKLCVKSALNVLAGNPEGFFLFVEDEGIDTGGHKNMGDFVANRIKHLDDAIAEAIEFAIKDEHTLVIVTSDHETGGLTLTEGIAADGKIKLNWAGPGHTGQSVPLFAFGPQAHLFTGVMENTEVAEKLGSVMKLKDFPE